MRTGTVIANPEIKEAQFLKKIISTDYYSTELSTDLQGVELSGAIKNIYSICFAFFSASSARPFIAARKYSRLSTAACLTKSGSPLAMA